jgi:D-3-phosphoglycerate dehydrogenase
MTVRILVADPLHPAGLELLREADVEVVELGDEPIETIIDDFDALIVRSKTIVDGALLERAGRLRVIARAGVGTDNVDVATATERGILVINAPTANLVSATEHTFALLLALTRRVPAAHESTRQGRWDRSSFMGTELRGKTLAVIGFGRIGQAVARRAIAFGMKIIAFDPFLDPDVTIPFDAELVDLDEALGRADIVTLHTPLTDQTKELISADRIKAMKPGAFLVNCARGGIVDEGALLAALDSGHLAGAALDAFAEEPPTDWRLAQHPAVVVTPHIGAQTVEAQERVATDTARMVLGALDGSLAVTAVNLPFRTAGARESAFVGLAERIALLAGLVLGGSVRRISVDTWGLDDDLLLPLTVAATRGALAPHLGDRINYVNATRIAGERGIEVVRSAHSDSDEYPHLVRVSIEGSAGSIDIAGAVLRDGDPRVVRYAGWPLEFRPEGRLLVLRNKDVPGVVGKLGATLGDAGINIAEIHLARLPSGDAIAVIRIDEQPGPELVSDLVALPEVHEAMLADLEAHGGP